MSNQDSFRIFIRVLLPVLSCGVFHSAHQFFKRKSLIMKNISTGFGLCAIAAAVALYPVLDRFAPIGKEAHAGIPVSAITSAALAQSAPTIVWYGTNAYTQVIGSGTGSRQSACGEILRGWSDGRVEVMTTRREITGYNGSQIDLWCTDGGYCTKPWILVSTPAQGYAAATDINADTSVDGADLSMLLGNWAMHHAMTFHLRIVL